MSEILFIIVWVFVVVMACIGGWTTGVWAGKWLARRES